MIRRIFMVLVALAAVAALSGCIRMSGTFPVPAGSEVATPGVAAPATRRVTNGVVGEKLSAGPWTVTVEEAKREGGEVGGAKPSAGSEFLTVAVGFENKGTEALEVRAEDFELIDPSGIVVPQAKLSQAAFNARSMRPVLARFGTSTVFVYQVPKGSARCTFAFSPPGQDTRLKWQVP